MKTKEEVKAKLVAIAEQLAKKRAQKIEWHSQEVHHIAVATYWMDALGVKEPAKRDELLKGWIKLGDEAKGFGANCSQLAQKLGRPTMKQSAEEFVGGF